MNTCKSCSKLFEPTTNMPQIYCNKACKQLQAKIDRDTTYVEVTGYMTPPCSKFQGTISEICVMEDLLRRGYMVFRNCAPHGSVDMIALASGPNKIPLRLEIKTVYSFEAPWNGRYEQGVHFDHWAGVKREGGEVRYDPPLPEVDWELEDEDE